MSVFVKSLKTFESDITGATKDYKVNNAVWLFMKSKFDLTQTEWAMQYAEEEVVNGARFVTCVLLANGQEVTEKQVLENTNAIEIQLFIGAYQEAMLPKRTEEEQEAEGKKEGK